MHGSGVLNRGAIIHADPAWYQRLGRWRALACLVVVELLGSRLDQDQNATTLAKATADAKLAASLS